MKTTIPPGARAAFTLIELVVVIAILIVIGTILLPHPHSGTRHKAALIVCLNNLKQVSLGYRLWAGAKSNLLPWEVSTNMGGTSELIPAGNAADHFLPLAQFVPRASVLFCPADRNFRERADDYLGFSNTNLSYFVALEACLTGSIAPSSLMLVGDRHLTISNQLVAPGLLTITNYASLGWRGFHPGRGVLGFVDGHAEATKRDGLPGIFQRQGIATNRLVIP
jgi:prepilin-type processing-associated H-X9-DG protein